MIYILRFFNKIYVTIFSGRVYQWIIKAIPLFRPVYETRNNESPIPFKAYLRYRVRGQTNTPYWPIHSTSMIRGSWRNIYVGVDAAPGISPGCYIQAVGKIYVGDYTQIAPNVGLISSNHFMLDIRRHVESYIKIGKYCRIGMGSIILPGVELGDFTTVAAGSVVTRSFPDGYCVISGNPATLVQDYNQDEKVKKKFLRYKNIVEYNGFIPADQFSAFRRKFLLV